MSNTPEIQSFIEAQHAAGFSKDEIGTALITDHGMTVNKALKACKDSGIKFGRLSQTGWREAIVQCFTDDPEATQELLADYLQGTVKDPKHYAAYYYEMAKGLVTLSLSEEA